MLLIFQRIRLNCLHLSTFLSNFFVMDDFSRMQRNGHVTIKMKPPYIYYKIKKNTQCRLWRFNFNYTNKHIFHITKTTVVYFNNAYVTVTNLKLKEGM